MYYISGCLTEQGIDYSGGDVSHSMESDVESCRSSCKSKGEDYFTFVVGQGPQWCWCKNSNAKRRKDSSVVSGEICPGEINSQNKFNDDF